MTAFNIMNSNVHPLYQAQISLLDVKKVTILSEYADYINIFSIDSTAEMPKYTDIKNHLIDLKDKQLSYCLIYNLALMEFERLKTYIETNLTNNFIRPNKLLAIALILLIQKKNDSF